MEKSDIQFKDELRKELIMYNNYMELLENGKYEKLKKLFQAISTA